MIDDGGPQGVDAAEYKEAILPRILEQVVSCKDTIAQAYLMECIIQVRGKRGGKGRGKGPTFCRCRLAPLTMGVPSTQSQQVFGDEFHIATLDQFLTACTQLKEKVRG